MSDRDADSRYQPVGDVWLGDLLWAIAKTTVGGPAERRAWAAELMGFASLESDALVAASDATAGVSAVADAPSVTADDLLRVPTVAGRGPALRSTESLPYRIVSHHRIEDSGSTRAWLDDAPTLPEVTEAQIAARPRLEPLFRPHTTRALLSTALSTRRAEGDIDLDEVLERTSRLRPLTTLPRRPVATLRFGIQLLIDRGAGMWLFHDDQRQLRHDILSVVGRDRAEILYFADCPLRGCGSAGPETWHPYEPPASGTPAVLLTDLGLARLRNPEIGAAEDEWLQFVRRLHGDGCPVLAVVPYGPDRWPARLRRIVAMVPWDRKTTVSDVRRLIGQGLQVPGQP